MATNIKWPTKIEEQEKRSRQT